MKSDIYQRITDKLIAIIEDGVNPWQRDWKTGNAFPGMPHNAVSGRGYRGINLMILIAEQQTHGYTSTGWITPKKAIEHGLNFKGQKTTEVIFWKRGTSTEDDGQGGEKTKSFMWAKSYRVLNLDQCEGDKSKLKGHKALELPEEIVETHALVEAVRSGIDVTLKHGGDRACYIPSADEVHMPPEKAFKTEAGYLGTAMHEFTHATGHKSRCDRGVKAMQSRFGTEAYAFEELVAELGACFLQETLGIEMHTENHASYLDNWLKVLKGDKRAIFTASSKAQQATDYILDKAGIKDAPVYDDEEEEKKKAA